MVGVEQGHVNSQGYFGSRFQSNGNDTIWIYSQDMYAQTFCGRSTVNDTGGERIL